MRVNVFKHLQVPKPVVGGLVLQVTSPKGIRQFREETQQYHYSLHTKLIQLYDDREEYPEKALKLDEGLYWVVAICRSKDLGLHWNHYLFKADSEGDIELLEEYPNQMSSDWIVEAMPTIKRYFKR